MKKLITLLFFILFITGCAIVPFVGTAISTTITGVTTWVGGTAHKYYNEEPVVLYRSAKTALTGLGYPIVIDEEYSDGSFYICACDRERFKITIRKVKPRITEVKIRINFLGDKPFAEMIYKEIDSNTNTVEFDDQGKPTKIKLLDRVDQ